MLLSFYSRSKEAIAVTRHNLPLQTRVVFLSIPQSFKVRRGLLLTQLPLPDTLVDMWRLVEGCGVSTILSLGGKDDASKVKVGMVIMK
jgi:hypothetical protein